MSFTDPDFWILLIYRIWDKYVGGMDITPFPPSIDQTLVATLLFIVSLLPVLLIYRWGAKRVNSLHEKEWATIKIINLEILSRDQLVSFLLYFVRLARNLLILGLVLIYLTITSSFFKATRDLATALLRSGFNTMVYMGQEVIAWLPNLVAICFLLFLAWQIMKLLKVIASAIDQEKLNLPGFHREWAMPTEKMLRFMIVVLTVILVAPFLPGFDTPAFKGVSVFLGVLLSLGSTGIVANIVAGYSLIYMRAFSVGDRVKIGPNEGRILETTMLITRLRTLRNEVVTIPNGEVLKHEIINYSILAKNEGIVVHTAVTIGYDVPWKKVEELMLQAAAATADVDQKKQSFILQQSLDDFSVSYELNVYTHNPEKMPWIKSQLNANLQQAFTEAQIEILSPIYHAQRDGNPLTIPSVTSEQGQL